MEFVFASDHLRNPYLDRITQTAVEVEVNQMAYCLQTCKINQQSYQFPNLTLPQRLCLCNSAII